MVNLGGFDANEFEPVETFDPIPEGWYTTAIVESQMKPTKNGNGQYLELKFQVLEGDHKGRNLWDRLNLSNPSAQAVQIAKRTLSSVCRAIGNLTPKTSEELHDIPLALKVTLRKREDNGQITNEIRGYKPTGEEKQSPEPKVEAAKIDSTKAPWE